MRTGNIFRNTICGAAVIFVLSAMFSCARKDFVIDGYFSKMFDTVALERTVILYSEYSDYSDTVQTVDGHFKFTGVCEQPLPFKIKISGVNSSADIFLENAYFKGTFTQYGFYLSDYDIEGGKTQGLITEVKRKVNDYKVRQAAILDSIIAGLDTSLTAQQRTAIIKPYADRINLSLDSLSNVLLDSIADASGDMYLIVDRLHHKVIYKSPDMVARKMLKVDKDKRFDNYPLANEIREYLKDNDAVRSGRPAPDFKMNDINGQERTFSDLYSQNDVTLLVFWTSWSPQTGRFIKEMERIESMYPSRLGVVAVSLDENEGAWKSYVEANSLQQRWTNLSDHTMWECPLRPLYKIKYFPQVIVVDRNGVILMSKAGLSNLGEMETLLAEKLG